MVIQECMLGLGEFTVDKPKSLCIAGPLNSGKKLLSQIIAFEIGKVGHRNSTILHFIGWNNIRICTIDHEIRSCGSVHKLPGSAYTYCNDFRYYG